MTQGYVQNFRSYAVQNALLIYMKMLGFFMSKLNIYDFVDKKKLDAVKKPIAQSHGLPNECYISKEYMELERKKLFENMWTVIGVASSIPNIGDAKPFNLQNIP